MNTQRRPEARLEVCGNVVTEFALLAFGAGLARPLIVSRVVPWWTLSPVLETWVEALVAGRTVPVAG